MTVIPQDISLPRDHLTQFYKVLHQGLVGTDQVGTSHWYTCL